MGLFLLLLITVFVFSAFGLSFFCVLSFLLLAAAGLKVAVQHHDAGFVNHVASVAFPQSERDDRSVAHLVFLAVKLGGIGEKRLRQSNTSNKNKKTKRHQKKNLKEESEIERMSGGNDVGLVAREAPLAKLLHSRDSSSSHLNETTASMKISKQPKDKKTRQITFLSPKLSEESRNRSG